MGRGYIWGKQVFKACCPPAAVRGSAAVETGKSHRAVFYLDLKPRKNRRVSKIVPCRKNGEDPLVLTPLSRLAPPLAASGYQVFLVALSFPFSVRVLFLRRIYKPIKTSRLYSGGDGKMIFKNYDAYVDLQLYTAEWIAWVGLMSAVRERQIGSAVGLTLAARRLDKWWG